VSPAVVTAGSVSFTGVDPSAPYRNVVTAAGADGAPRATVASAPGNMVVSVLAAGCNIDSSTQQLAWSKNVNCDSEAGNGAQATGDGRPSVNISYAMTLDHWALIGADVNARSPCSSGP
jgi:hypothetical protein